MNKTCIAISLRTMCRCMALTLVVASSVDARANPSWMPASDWDGSLAGRSAVLALAVDPIAPDHVYAASGNQVFLSVDGGRVFAALPPVPTVRRIRSLAVLHDATMQAPRLLVGIEISGALVSADGGLTYMPGTFTGTPNSGTIWNIFPASATSDVAYALGATTYRTDDGGQTWRALVVPNAGTDGTTNLAVGERGDVVFAGRDGGLLKSIDGGANWSVLAGGLPAPPYNSPVLPAIDPADPQRMAAIIPALGTYRSDNAGISWRRTGDAPFECCLYTLLMSGDTLWITINGGAFIARSRDGGASWSGLPLPSNPWEQLLRDPATGRLYAGSRNDESTAGFVRSLDGGDSWRTDSFGMGSAPVQSLLVDPGRALYALTSNNALHAMTARQAPWRDITHPWTFSIELGPAIVTGPGGLMTSPPGSWRSTDAGTTWTQISTATIPRIDVLAVEPAIPAVVYGVERRLSAAGHSLFLSALLPRRSVDGGATWMAIDSGLPPFTRQLVATGDSRLVAATDAGVWFSANGGNSWRALGGIAGTVRAMCTRPDAPDKVYLLTDDGFYGSLDGGASFARASSLPVASASLIAPDGHASLRVYLLTPDGNVYTSSDDGHTWLALGGSAGLSEPPTSSGYVFNAVAASPWTAGTLYGATSHGVLKFVARLDTVVAQEFHHAQFDHYFMTTSATEAGKLATTQTPGWQPTGRRFAVVSAIDAQAPDLPVCRFFSAAFAPRSSHFYTPYADECTEVKASGAWTFEGIAFALALPQGTPCARQCPAGTQALYRAYNNFADGAPNHRYTIESGVLDGMTARGWVMEGEAATRVFACVPTQD